MNIKPEQIPDEAASLALEAYDRSFNSGHDFSINHMKAAISAALPVLLVQVGYQETKVVSNELVEMDIWHWMPNQPIPPSTPDVKREPVYVIKDTPNADQ